MPTNGLRTVARHETNHDAPHNRHDHNENTKLIPSRRHELSRNATIECNIRDEANEQNETLSDNTRGDSDDNSKSANQEHTPIDKGFAFRQVL
jgi:hypothetical protein